MEHSWWFNSFCNSFAENLYNKEGRVCWVGDYAGEDGDFDFILNSAFYVPSYKEIWGEPVKLHGSQSTDFTLDNKFLLNHDTKEFIDLNDYKEKARDYHRLQVLFRTARRVYSHTRRPTRPGYSLV